MAQWGPYPVDNDAEAGVCVGTGHLNKSELLAEDSGTEIDITFPYYVWLNRRDLNRVIAMLRRARRATYGEDE